MQITFMMLKQVIHVGQYIHALDTITELYWERSTFQNGVQCNFSLYRVVSVGHLTCLSTLLSILMSGWG